MKKCFDRDNVVGGNFVVILGDGRKLSLKDAKAFSDKEEKQDL